MIAIADIIADDFATYDDDTTAAKISRLIITITIITLYK